MHMRGTPETMQRETTYADVTAEVAAFLAGRLERAEAGGGARGGVGLCPPTRLGKSGGGVVGTARAARGARRAGPARAGGRVAQEFPRAVAGRRRPAAGPRD